MGPGKGAGTVGPYGAGPPGLPEGTVADSNPFQHGSGAEASAAAASDDVEGGRSPKRRIGEDSRPREPSPMVTPGVKAPPRQGKGNSPGFEQGPTVEQLMNFWNMFAMGQKGGRWTVWGQSGRVVQ